MHLVSHSLCLFEYEISSVSALASPCKLKIFVTLVAIGPIGHRPKPHSLHEQLFHFLHFNTRGWLMANSIIQWRLMKHFPFSYQIPRQTTPDEWSNVSYKIVEFYACLRLKGEKNNFTVEF